MSRPSSEERSLKDTLRTLDDRWFGPRSYWFGCGSPTALGVMRILIGFLAAVDLLMVNVHWEDFFSERGFVPKALTQMWFDGDPYVWWPTIFGHPLRNVPVWEGGRILPKPNLLFAVPNDSWAHVFYWGVFVCAILTMFGLWTRLSTFLLAIGILCIHYRDPLILHGGDTVLRISCLYLMLAPCGSACSVDRLIGLWKGWIQPGPVSVSLWVQRLVTYNVALVYITTLWNKCEGDTWKGGSAVYYSLNLQEFFKFPYPHFVLQMPWVLLITWATMLIEFSMGTIVFYRPWRKYVLLSGVLLHAGIEYTMNIPLFGVLLVSLYVCFYDGEEVAAWFQALGAQLARFRVVVHMPQGRPLRPNALAVLRAMDFLGLVSYVEGDRDAMYITRAGSSTAQVLAT